ncbi:MAG: DNA-protecting protein DprA [Chloroflexi bacterium]|nr:DNA-protecting protein DprA [Chloroflexota bacterium]
MTSETSFWLAFSHIRGIGAVRYRKLLDFFGDLSIAWQADKKELLSAGLTVKAADLVLSTRKTLSPEKLEDELERKGIKFLTWDSSSYPRYLLEIAQPPPVLYYVGDILPEDELAIAIVGTRNVTKYGRQITQDTAAYLAANRITVVSGLARGVDGIAHQAAIEAGGRTFAVLGSGVDVIYPPEHRKLAREIVKQGALISDYAPGTKPDGINFPPRNRIISGLSRGTVVIEAGERSGALITSKFAIEQNREVFAVPGSVLSQMSKGTNQLIGDGATPMTNPIIITDTLNLARTGIERKREKLDISSTEKNILRVLGDESLHIDEICARTSMTIEKLTAELTMMELKGIVQRDNGMEYQRVKKWDF